MYDFYSDLTVDDVPFNVWYCVRPGERPTYEDPGCPPEIKIVSVKHKNAEFIDLLSPTVLGHIQESLEESADEVLNEYIEDLRSNTH